MSEHEARQTQALIRAHRTTEKTALEHARNARKAGEDAKARQYEAMAAQARQKAREAGG